MKDLVVYYSETGFTKRYVDSLERRIAGLDVIEIKNFKKKNIQGHDCIFYGGPIRNHKILGLDKFLKHYKLMEDKNIFIFATGIEPITPEKKESIIYANALQTYHVRLYLLPGGLDVNKMKPMKRKLLLYGTKMAAKKEPALAQNLSMFDRAIDFTNTEMLSQMLDVYHRVKLKETKK